MSTPASHQPQSAPEPRKPLRPPPRYVNKARCVQVWHDYLVASCSGEYPMLKTLSASCGVPKSTVHDYCRLLGLPLAQSRSRRGLPLFRETEKKKKED